MNNEWNEERVQQFIIDGIEESLTIEYKSAGAFAKTNEKRRGITKHVSAMANSAGGLLFYGIAEYNEREKKHLPEKIDPIDRTEFSKEWLEQVIHSIQPRPTNITIHPVPFTSGPNDVVYVVEIPQTTVPLQATDNRYYRRFNFMAEPMSDYEINDIRNRGHRLETLIIFDALIVHGFVVHFFVKNIGSLAAYDVMFKFDPEPIWHQETPPLFARATKVIPPGRVFEFPYYSYSAILKNDDIPMRFDIETSYYHPQISTRVTENLHIDFMDFNWTMGEKSDVEAQTETLKIALSELTEEIRAIKTQMEQIRTIASPTGLNLSISTLRNLRHLQRTEDTVEKIKLDSLDHRIFQEVLGVDTKMAFDIWGHFASLGEQKPLEDIDGMTDELLEKMHLYFDIDEN